MCGVSERVFRYAYLNRLYAVSLCYYYLTGEQSNLCAVRKRVARNCSCRLFRETFHAHGHWHKIVQGQDNLVSREAF